METITQEKLARKAKISPAMLSLIYAGKRRPSWPAAKRLAKITGTTERVWMEGTPRQIKLAVKNNKA